MPAMRSALEAKMRVLSSMVRAFGRIERVVKQELALPADEVRKPLGKDRPNVRPRGEAPWRLELPPRPGPSCAGLRGREKRHVPVACERREMNGREAT